MADQLFFAPLIHLRTLIANSEAFQTETAAADAAAALAFVHYYSAGVTDDAPRPRAIIGGAPGRTITKMSTTGWELNGALELELQRNSDPADVGDPTAGLVTFGTWLDDIVDEMKLLSGSDGFLEIKAFRLIGDPIAFREKVADGVEWWGCMLEIMVGGG